MKKAVILAAGRGTRMKDLTEGRPKPMLAVRGKPILEHVLEGLRSAGFSQALLVTGYRREMVEEYFRCYPLDIRFQVQEPIDGTGRAVLLAREFVAGDAFLMCFGDILVDAEDYRGLAECLESDPAAEAVAGAKYVEDPHQGAAIYEENGVITRIIEKPPKGTSTTHWNSAGLYAFRPSIFDELERVPRSPRGEYELTSAVEQMLAAGRRLRLYAIRGAWRDVGRPEDLAAV